MVFGETVYLTTEDEILKHLEQSKLNKQSLFVYGGGKNWGYGGSNPIDPQAQVLSLEKMNKILSFDEQLGVVEIEPGVTQGQLEEYLEKKNCLILFLTQEPDFGEPC